VIFDVETGACAQVAGTGRHNHDNHVVSSGGWNQIAMLSGDDAFGASSSHKFKAPERPAELALEFVYCRVAGCCKTPVLGRGDLSPGAVRLLVNTGRNAAASKRK
jgi:hypothetical protein